MVVVAVAVFVVSCNTGSNNQSAVSLDAIVNNVNEDLL